MGRDPNKGRQGSKKGSRRCFPNLGCTFSTFHLSFLQVLSISFNITCIYCTKRADTENEFRNSLPKIIQIIIVFVLRCLRLGLSGVHLNSNFGRARRIQGRAASPLKPAKVTLFTMIFYNSESSIRDIRPFCRPLFCYSSVEKLSSSLLQ